VSRDAREAALALEAGDPKRVISGSGERSEATVAFLFPGQGAQHVGMAAGLYRSEPVFAAELDACAAAFEPHLGLDIRSVVFAPPDDREAAERRLAETAFTQPALFAVEYALARLWMAWGVMPAAMIGHSLGEYVAACVADTLGRDDAAAVVAARARLMQEQPRGRMLAVRLRAADLERHLGPDTCVSVLNAPELTVASGSEEAIAALESKLGAEGVSCRKLATSHAFHSPMMEGALAPFRKVLESVRLAPPRAPWISCLTGDWITPEQAVDPGYWVQQLRQPVRFSDGVSVLARDPERVLLEVGPGRTLSALVLQHRERPASQAVVSSLGTDTDPGRDVTSVLDALGRLWIAGVKPDWRAVHGGESRRRVPLPTYPFERKRHWIDPPSVEAAARGLEPGRSVSASQEEAATADSPAPVAGPGSETEGVGVEGRVRSLLSAASGIPAAEIDASLSFLEQGFDSLLLAQVSIALEKAFGVTIAFRQLMEELSTAAALVRHLETRANAQAAEAAKPGPTAAAAAGAASPAPPVPGARLGRDAAGNEAWFVPDPARPGKYLQVTKR
jgi:acyl transferase domain-containing protein